MSVNKHLLRVAGGWNNVLVRFSENEVSRMRRYTDGFMVLLIDLDGKEERLRDAKAQVPRDLAERVFILGTLSTPEALKKAGLGTYEIIGKAMAQDCRDETTATWGHLLLRHNSSELDRLRTHVRPILFDPPNPAAHASGHG